MLKLGWKNGSELITRVITIFESKCFQRGLKKIIKIEKDFPSCPISPVGEECRSVRDHLTNTFIKYPGPVREEYNTTLLPNLIGDCH